MGVLIILHSVALQLTLRDVTASDSQSITIFVGQIHSGVYVSLLVHLTCLFGLVYHVQADAGIMFIRIGRKESSCKGTYADYGIISSTCWNALLIL